MKIFYINLDFRVDRRKHMDRMLGDLGLTGTRFNAVCPTVDELKFGKYKKFYKRATSRINSYLDSEDELCRGLGVFGCYLSHWEIHKSQLGNSEPYIILEDDVLVTSETFSQLDKIVSRPEFKNWDIVRSLWPREYHNKDFKVVHDKGKCFGGVYLMLGVNRESAYSNSYPEHTITAGTHFCAFRDADRILDYLDKENVYNIDSVYSTCMLNVYHKLIASLEREVADITDIPKPNNPYLK